MRFLESLQKKTGVEPFKDAEAPEDGEEEVEQVAWIGPFHAGFCVVELHGPLQVLFALLAAVALAFLIIELLREGYDTLRFLGGLAFVLVCAYLVWLTKSIYLLKAFRKEVEKFRQLNEELSGQRQKLEGENEAYGNRNQEQARLNEELLGKVDDLSQVERQLRVLAAQCEGSIQHARQFLERLERNLQLNTVNSAFLFFAKADVDKNGTVDGEEVGKFVDSMAFLWQHLPHFDAGRMKASITKQGGISMEQVYQLVDSMMLGMESSDPKELAQKVEGLLFNPEASEDAMDQSARTICPPNGA